MSTEQPGRLVTLKIRVDYTKNRKWKDLFLCFCGNEFITIAADVRSGRTKSCGCWKTSCVKINCKTHGKSKTPEHRAWLEMKRRCYNSNRPGWQNYGGRGIRVCDQWLNSFQQFLKDLGPKPDPTYSLDRINNDGNYEPGNCRWANKQTQARNQRRHKGKTFNAKIK